MKPTDIAVVIAYHNNSDTFPAVVEALNASPVKLHLIVVDDASRKGEAKALSRIKTVHRLTRLRHPHNKGFAAALNTGIRYALRERAAFIAINDADDLPRPNRFALQAAFLKRNPDVVAVGGWARAFNQKTGEVLYDLKPPADDASIKAYFKLNSPFVHPTVMFRASAFASRLYDETFKAACDYEFLSYLAGRHKLANLARIVLDYCVREKSISVSRRRLQILNRLKVQWAYGNLWSPRVWVGLVRTIAILVAPQQLVEGVKASRRA